MNNTLFINLPSSLQHINASLDSLNTSFLHEAHSIQELDVWFTDLETQVSVSFNNVNASLSDVETQVDVLNTVLSDMETQMHVLHASFITLSVQLQHTNASLLAFQSSINNDITRYNSVIEVLRNQQLWPLI